jgi:hypothetical protein
MGKESVQELSFCVHVQIEIPKCQEVVTVSTVPLRRMTPWIQLLYTERQRPKEPQPQSHAIDERYYSHGSI